MKTKLALSVSAQSSQRAKTAARRRVVPLFQVVDENVDRLDPTSDKVDGEVFLKRWQGAFKLSPESLKDERVAAIIAKHMR